MSRQRWRPNAPRATPRARPPQAFHEKLCGIRILDQACGNFLYVSLEMKRLEGEVLEALASLTGQGRRLIAKLVLWIGNGNSASAAGCRPSRFCEISRQSRSWTPCSLGTRVKFYATNVPVRSLGRIRKEKGSRSIATKIRNGRNGPRRTISSANPPFIGGKDIRGRMGEGYAKALRAAHPH
jgi:hypothetical protein